MKGRKVILVVVILVIMSFCILGCWGDGDVRGCWTNECVRNSTGAATSCPTLTPVYKESVIEPAVPGK